MRTRAARDLKAGDLVLLPGTSEAKVIDTKLVHHWDDGPVIPSDARIFITVEKLHTQRRPPPRAVLELGLTDLIEVPSDT